MHLRIGVSCPENTFCGWRVGTFSPTPRLPGRGERGWSMSQSCLRDEASVKSQEVGPPPAPPASGSVNLGRFCTSGELEPPSPFSIPFPVLLFHLPVPESSK